jgi:hypothetical protein
MYAMRFFFGLLFLGMVTLIGCTRSTSTPKAEPGQAGKTVPSADQESKIQASLAKLSDTDRPLAEAQQFCPIQKTRLGMMGKPYRIEIDGQPIFLCCSGCADDARADPKKTLDQVAQFKKGLK